MASGSHDSAKSARAARLKSALRDNLKRRKAQARGRTGKAIVSPEDDSGDDAADVLQGDAGASDEKGH